MNGNEKLLAARAEIEELLRRYDIAGHVVLYMPGFVENFSCFEPSFSRAKQIRISDHGFELRLNSKLEDYNGDREAQRRDLEATAGMFSAMGRMLASTALSVIKTSEYVDKTLNSTHTGFKPLHRDKS